MHPKGSAYRTWIEQQKERAERIREAAARGESLSRIAKRYRISRQRVHQIVNPDTNGEAS